MVECRLIVTKCRCIYIYIGVSSSVVARLQYFAAFHRILYINSLDIPHVYGEQKTSTLDDGFSQEELGDEFLP